MCEFQRLALSFTRTVALIMRVSIIDDNQEFARELSNRLGVAQSVAIIPAGNSAHEIARAVNDFIDGEEASLIFISLTGIFGDNTRQQHEGVTILKQLRFAESFYDHASIPSRNKTNKTSCILYSFFSLELILSNCPAGTMLCSEGTTYLRLPCRPADIDLEDLVQRKASINRLKTYIDPSNLPDNRHDWANWWGLKQLVDVHRVVLNSQNFEYPAVVCSALQQTKNQELILLFGNNVNSLNSIDLDLLTKIKILRSYVAKRKPRILHIDDKSQDGWSEIFANIIYDNTSLTLSNSTNSGASDFIDFRIDGDPVFRSLIEVGAVPQNKSENALNRLYKIIRKAIHSSGLPDVVLMDLRLFGEQGVQFDAKRLSGAKVLNWLRGTFRGIPVIVTTASNKAWSYEQLLQLGADGYWIKEGFDDRRSPEQSVENYLRFLELIKKAISEEYKFLNIFDLSRLALLRSGSVCWWEGHVWTDTATQTSVRTAGRRDKIEKLLTDTVLLLRTYLQQKIMGQGFQDAIAEWSWTSAIIRHAANCIEEVHRFDECSQADQTSATIGRYWDKSSGKWQNRRGDWIAFKLYELRNRSAHFNRAEKINWKLMKGFLSHLVAYLTVGPQLLTDPDKSLNFMGGLDSNYRKIYSKLNG